MSTRACFNLLHAVTLPALLLSSGALEVITHGRRQGKNLSVGGVRFSAGVIGTGRGYAAFRCEYLARFGIRYGLPRPRFWCLCLPP